MNKTEKTEALPLLERRKLLREFREHTRLTVTELAGLAEVSQPMLSQFETGVRNLSEDAWARLLVAMEQFLIERKANLKADNDRLQADLAKAGETATKLGAAVPEGFTGFMRNDYFLDLCLPDRPGALDRYKETYEDFQRRFGTEGEALFRQLIEAQEGLKKQRETIGRLQDELTRSHIEAASLKEWLDSELVATLAQEQSLEAQEKALNLRLRVHREEARQMQAPSEQPAGKALSVRLFEAVLSGRPLTQEEHQQADAARETVRNLKRKIRGNK